MRQQEFSTAINFTFFLKDAFFFIYLQLHFLTEGRVGHYELYRNHGSSV